MVRPPKRKRSGRASASSTPASHGPSERELRYVQRANSRDPHINRVIQTLELLECILVNLDMRTLLVSAQRVCRTWHSLINTSPALQVALFFKPDGSWDVQRGHDHEAGGGSQDVGKTRGGSVRKNPLLASLFPAWFDDYVSPGPEDSHSAPRAVYRSQSKPPPYTEFAGQPFAKNSEVFMRRTASWRRMLVQQPPAHHVGEWITTWGWLGHQDASMKYYKDGLRMGQLYDRTAQHALSISTGQCILWGAEGIAGLHRARAPMEVQVRRGKPLENWCPLTNVPEVEAQLVEMAGQADLMLAVSAYMTAELGPPDELKAFFRNFLWEKGTDGTAGRYRQNLPKGKKVWERQGMLIEEDDDL
ncbi:F-box domain-containing protein [Seiridium cupressi]